MVKGTAFNNGRPALRSVPDHVFNSWQSRSGELDGGFLHGYTNVGSIPLKALQEGISYPFSCAVLVRVDPLGVHNRPSLFRQQMGECLTPSAHRLEKKIFTCLYLILFLISLKLRLPNNLATFLRIFENFRYAIEIFHNPRNHLLRFCTGPYDKSCVI